jgi:hypothetical protein
MGSGLVKMTLLLRPEEAARLEAYCLERGHKKSTLVATLVRDYLDVQTGKVLPKARPAARHDETWKDG